MEAPPNKRGRNGDVRSLAGLAWERYPIRVCRSLHHCEFCVGQITLGQKYLDGGYGRRGHVSCYERWMNA
jgi:hypothetical protein